MDGTVVNKMDNEKLRSIKDFKQLVIYLKDELDWPIDSESFDDITFDYNPEELGIDTKTAANIVEIKQLRPLVTGQLWGIFFVRFEPKRLPVVALRRILNALVMKKRASAHKTEQASWNLRDLLFILNYGEENERQMTMAHFSQDEDGTDLPTLNVLGWDQQDTALHIAQVTIDLKEKLHWPEDDSDLDEWRKQWSSAFTLRNREVITTSRDLAIRLADLAQRIRSRAKAVLEIETERGQLKKMYKAFKEALLHNLSEDGFSDMFAQTITYGLLTARVSQPESVTVDKITDMVLVTNPFLKDLLSTFFTAAGRKEKIDFDELGINDVVLALRNANMGAVLRDFGNKNPEEDPVVHFYELFLKEYDPHMRTQRGVFYTPKPVVSYIVRSIHETLKKEFLLEDGLADTTTWATLKKRNLKFKIPDGVKPEEPFVQILDPATGTGTFLVEVIALIYETLKTKWEKSGKNQQEIEYLWNVYVPKYLLPRLYGFELMMAPYAIAHMKVGLKLHETGYHFQSEARARIYLTNTLEPSTEAGQITLLTYSKGLAQEVLRVNEIKSKKRFTIIIGNPPYSVSSSNKDKWIQNLIKDYKKDLGERKINLDDDYIKFIRLVERYIEMNEIGIVGMITNNSFIDGITHRVMRKHLLETFEDIYVLNLHGDSKKGEETLDGSKDENVFDIQQGVAITLFVRKRNNKKELCVIKYAELFGLRKDKYISLNKSDYGKVNWKTLDFDKHYYFFVPKDFGMASEYNTGFKLDELFNVYSVGIGTKVDSISIDFDYQKLKLRVKEILDNKYDRKVLISNFKLSENTTWEYEKALTAIYDNKKFIKYDYRPFDYRYIFYDENFLSRSRSNVMDNFYYKNNYGLELGKTSFIAFISNKVSDEHFGGGKSYKFPLYVYNSDDFKTPNFNKYIYNKITHNINAKVVPENVLDYIYAVLYSSDYRKKYAEFLKIGFPRIPYPKGEKQFFILAKLGNDLRLLHLLESPKVDKFITSYSVIGGNAIEKVTYIGNRVFINKTQYFDGVPEAIWKFYIGGYQPVQKWLKDRKGRTLSKEDIIHYQKIVVAVAETIRLMEEIDSVIKVY
jgi:predicted helicase